MLRCSEKTMRPSSATLSIIVSHLARGDFYLVDPIASFAWPLLVQAGGLAKLEGGRLQLTARGRTALRKPPAEVIRALWQRWVTHAVIDEFSRIDEIKGQRARNVLSAAGPRRQAVAAALAGCPPGEWLGVDTLFAIMRRGNMRPRSPQPNGAVEALPRRRALRVHGLRRPAGDPAHHPGSLSTRSDRHLPGTHR